jgi:uncharacterized protein (DUF305 family)
MHEEEQMSTDEKVNEAQDVAQPHAERGAGIHWRWPILIVSLMLLSGLAGWWLGGSRLPAEDGPEARFARDMSAHHDQAVEMAFIIRDRTADEELRTFTLDIILTQQAQSGQMQGWLAAWGHPLGGSGPPMGGQGEMMGMATLQQIDELQSLPVAQAEVAFLQLMIRHHQGGVMMAEQALAQTRRPEVVRLAESIIDGQQGEITYMEQLLEQRGAAPMPPLAPMPADHGEHPAR